MPSSSPAAAERTAEPLEPTPTGTALTPDEEREALLAAFDFENDPTYEQWCKAAVRTSGYLDIIGAHPSEDQLDFDVFVLNNGDSEDPLGNVNCFLYLPDTVLMLSVGVYGDVSTAADAYGLYEDPEHPFTVIDVDAPAWDRLRYTEYEPGTGSGEALLITENVSFEWPIDGALEDRGADALDVSASVASVKDSSAPPLSTEQIQQATRALVEWIADHQPSWSPLQEAAG